MATAKTDNSKAKTENTEVHGRDARATGENPSLCYQCAKCSAGCPVAEQMDILPHQVMHLAGLGMDDKLLGCNTIWMCAGCYTCAVRCPNDINITQVMDDLRAKAQAQGVACPRPDVLKFHQAFLRDLGRRGRIHEMRMVAEYNLGIGKPLNNVDLGPKMFFKGRLHLLPPKAVKGFKSWMKRLNKK